MHVMEQLAQPLLELALPGEQLALAALDLVELLLDFLERLERRVDAVRVRRQSEQRLRLGRRLCLARRLHQRLRQTLVQPPVVGLRARAAVVLRVPRRQPCSAADELHHRFRRQLLRRGRQFCTVPLVETRQLRMHRRHAHVGHALHQRPPIRHRLAVGTPGVAEALRPHARRAGEEQVAVEGVGAVVGGADEDGQDGVAVRLVEQRGERPLEQHVAQRAARFERAEAAQQAARDDGHDDAAVRHREQAGRAERSADGERRAVKEGVDAVGRRAAVVQQVGERRVGVLVRDEQVEAAGRRRRPQPRRHAPAQLTDRDDFARHLHLGRICFVREGAVLEPHAAVGRRHEQVAAQARKVLGEHRLHEQLEARRQREERAGFVRAALRQLHVDRVARLVERQHQLVRREPDRHVLATELRAVALDRPLHPHHQRRAQVVVRATRQEALAQRRLAQRIDAGRHRCGSEREVQPAARRVVGGVVRRASLEQRGHDELVVRAQRHGEARADDERRQLLAERGEALVGPDDLLQQRRRRERLLDQRAPVLLEVRHARGAGKLGIGVDAGVVTHKAADGVDEPLRVDDHERAQRRRVEPEEGAERVEVAEQGVQLVRQREAGVRQAALGSDTERLVQRQLLPPSCLHPIDHAQPARRHELGHRRQLVGRGVDGERQLLDRAVEVGAAVGRAAVLDRVQPEVLFLVAPHAPERGARVQLAVHELTQLAHRALAAPSTPSLHVPTIRILRGGSSAASEGACTARALRKRRSEASASVGDCCRATSDVTTRSTELPLARSSRWRSKSNISWPP
mmetsp:Transcript_41236/g.113399  ORF Transcript_41236/g.113399 Transcript_41236/m.113399 type:complete len:802 (+) Transcript_41236:1744-4149(+)